MIDMQHCVCFRHMPWRFDICTHCEGLPWRLRWERICLQCRRPRFSPWLGKIPWRREWLPTPVFLPGELHGQRSLAGYSPRGCKESDTTEWRSSRTYTHRHCEMFPTVNFVNIHHLTLTTFYFLWWELLRSTVLATFKYTILLTISRTLYGAIHSYLFTL